MKNLLTQSKMLRKLILEASYKSNNASHIGGALSIVEILIIIYFKFKINLKFNKDRFILSKGHGFLALLGVLYLKKFITKKKFLEFQTDGSEIIAHPIMNLKIGIETSNGSLGQGLSYGAGLALAYKKKKKKNKVFVLMGDGECYEGLVWEAAITSAQCNLNNLVAIIDSNGYQNDGKINKEMNYKSLKKKWEGFGWNCDVCDGHNLKKIYEKLKINNKKKPMALIAMTTKGKGVKFMENNNDWHHNRLTKDLFLKASELINKN